MRITDIGITEDREVDEQRPPIYLTFSSNAIKNTLVVSANCNIDLDANDHIVGIEIL